MIGHRGHERNHQHQETGEGGVDEVDAAPNGEHESRYQNHEKNDGQQTDAHESGPDAEGPGDLRGGAGSPHRGRGVGVRVAQKQDRLGRPAALDGRRFERRSPAHAAGDGLPEALAGAEQDCCAVRQGFVRQRREHLQADSVEADVPNLAVQAEFGAHLEPLHLVGRAVSIEGEVHRPSALANPVFRLRPAKGVGVVLARASFLHAHDGFIEQAHADAVGGGAELRYQHLAAGQVP